MAVRGRVQFADKALPTRSPIRRWEHFWAFLDSQRAAAGREPVPRPIGHDPTTKVYARVDAGRWIADCPHCGAAFNLPTGEARFWCTECAGNGSGHTYMLVWPDRMDRITTNIETLPRMMQHWPCRRCRTALADGRELCASCRAAQGV